MTKIIVGETTFHSDYADSRPKWRVTKTRGDDTYECTIELDELDYAGVINVFGGERIRQLMGYEKRTATCHDYYEALYKGLNAGTIVHYHNGFGQFVRCKVLADKQLTSMALVGNWRSHDLPSRGYDGEINYPYHCKNVMAQEEESWRPHGSNIYEFSELLQEQYAAPKDLYPIDLSVPDMTPEEAEWARQYKWLQEIVKAANIVGPDCPPDTCLLAIQSLVRLADEGESVETLRTALDTAKEASLDIY